MAHCFESRNNRLYNSWALGPLYFHANRRGAETIEIDLLSKSISPHAPRFTSVVEFFATMLQNQLVKCGLETRNIESATINLHFDKNTQRKSYRSEYHHESLFTIRVTIKDDHQRLYSATEQGWCYPLSY